MLLLPQVRNLEKFWKITGQKVAKLGDFWANDDKIDKFWPKFQLSPPPASRPLLGEIFESVDKGRNSEGSNKM